MFSVINEIERNKRFELDFLIVARAWTRPVKSSREQMFVFYTDIVKQLEILEQDTVFPLYSSSSALEGKSLKVGGTYSLKI